MNPTLTALMTHGPTVGGEGAGSDGKSERVDSVVVIRCRINTGGTTVLGVGGTSVIGERGD